jgi:Cu-processing system permease protein
MVVTALALFFSTFSSPLLATLLTLGLWVAGHFNADLRNFENVVKSEPLIWTAKVLYYVLPNLAPFNVKAEVVHGFPVAARHVGMTMAYAVVYTGILLTAAVAIFRRRDFK